jgi:hypothetical protein
LLDTFGQDDSEREMDSGDDDSGTRRSEEGEEEEGDKVVDGSEHAKPVEPATKWCVPLSLFFISVSILLTSSFYRSDYRTGVLLPSETILFASPVLVKRGFLTKKRNLILTDYPRLICIKETPLKVTLKSEVFVGAALRGGVTKPGAMAFVRAETDGDKSFMIKTVRSSSASSRFSRLTNCGTRTVTTYIQIRGTLGRSRTVGERAEGRAFEGVAG